jgi:hypothetical protein
MACEEMQLFYAYLDAVEEAKRKAQPWECEVTLIGENGERDVVRSEPIGEIIKGPAPVVVGAKGAGFACDEPE